jgi:Ca2+-binding RTX toxin-like protein
VHDGSISAPTFSIQANDGAGLNNLSNVFVGSVTFVPVVGAILGDAGNNTLAGTGGNDVFQGFGGNDTIDGQSGFDRAIYLDATGSITVDMTAGTVSGPGVGNDTLVRIEAIQGSNFADHYSASGFAGNSGVPGTPIGFNSFEGMGGDDVIVGTVNSSGQISTRISYLSATAAVVVDIAAGTASGDASVGHDSFTNVNAVIGSAFADVLRGSDNLNGTYEQYEGRAGDDLIDGRGGYDFAVYNNDPSTTTGITVNLAAGLVTGDATIGIDTLRSVEGVRGTNFADTYDATGFSGSSTNAGSSGTFNNFDGAAGDDTIIGNGNTRIQYSQSLDGVTVDIAAGTARGTAAGDIARVGTDTFSGVNSVMGSMFADVLLGSANNDTFMGLAGNDLIDGRGGFDSAVYSNLTYTTGGVAVDMASGSVTGDASTGTDTLRSIESVQGTLFADSYVASNFGATGFLDPAANNVGNSGTFNQFEGLGGDDSIVGNGNTRIVYFSATSGVTITFNLNGWTSATSGATGSVTGDASVGTDTFSGIGSVSGSSYADTITGSNNPNNTAEEFSGRAGNDLIDGKGGFDRAFYNNDPTASGIQIDMASGVVTGDTAIGTDTLRSMEAIRGTNFADAYVATNFGVSGANIGSFGSFNEFEGMGGNDSIIGNGNTRLAFYNALGGVVVDLSTGTSHGAAAGDVAGVGDDTFSGANAVRGSNFADAIFGDAFANTLEGRDGDDRIDGRGGADILTGGNGADTFIYADGGGSDQIVDFSQGQGDKIDLTGVAGVFSLAQVQALATQNGPDTVLAFGAGNTLTLQNVTLGNLIASDFVFSNSTTGTSGADTLTGTGAADGIFGLAGNDRLQGLGGNDILDGGDGIDRAIYTDATGSVTINLAAGTASGAGVGSDTLSGIEGIVGSDFADTYNAAGFAGSSGLTGVVTGQNDFEGRGGDDVIIGNLNPLGQALTRAAYLSATGSVTVDLAAGTANGDASVGHDTLSNVSTIWGSAYNDTLLGSDNGPFTYETYEGRAGDDFIDGRGGYDLVTYNNDPATSSGITVHLANGIVTGDVSVGTDTLRHVEGARGTNFNDVLDATGFGGAGAANIGSSGTFNDFAGAGGNDTIIGNGNTRLNYQSATASVSVDLETSVIGATTAITVAGSATGTSEGTDNFTGVNAVQGSTLADTLLGSSFGNTFTGLGGNDYIDGRGGFDTASYNSFNTVTSGVVVNLAAGTVTGDASVGSDTLRSIEGVQGTFFDDTFDATGYGQSGALNVSDSNGSFNQFEGLGGNDIITGNGSSRVIFANAIAGVTITLGVGGAGSAHGTAAGDVAKVGTDTFTGGVNSATGSNSADVYNASSYTSGFNAFQGNAGDDTISGNGSTQIQFGNATSGVTITIGAGGNGMATGDASVGTDTFTGVNSAVGGNLADIFDASAFVGFNQFQGNAGNDSITGNGSTQLVYGAATGSVTIDLALGIADGDGSVGHDTFSGVNNVLGSNFNDTILGGLAGETLNGGNGNDLIDGGGGNDTLIGGLGTDTFVYATGGTDTVADFNRAQGDKLDVSGLSAIATFADIQSRTTVSGGNTVINFGGGNSLTLTGVTSIQQSDFVFRTVTNGLSGADLLLGTEHSDSIFGLAGNDILKGFAGNDQLDGGTGRDVADYSDATGGVTVDMAAGVVNGNASVGSDTLRTIETVRGTDFSDTYVAVGFNRTSVNNAQDIPIISSINNTFEGGGGNDTIFGSSGSQISYSTGNGGTQISYAHALDGVQVDLRAGTAQGIAANDVAHVGTDSFVDVSGVVGSDYNDLLSGTDSPDHVDVFYGGRGQDLIDGRDGNDFAGYYAFFDSSVITGGISVNLAGGTVTGDASVGTDTLRSIELVRGTQFGDTYNAVGFGSGSTNAGSRGTFNQFEGMDGDDIVTGNGNTRIDYHFALAAVTVDLASGTGHSSVADNAGVGNDTILTGVNSVRGSSYDDSLSGGAGNEYFLGGYGNDLIDGRGGFDRGVYSTGSDDAVTGGIVIDLAAGTVQGDVSVGNDTLRSIEGITGTDFADTFVATGYGVAGALNVGNNGTFNEIEGGGGNDTITGNGNTRIAFYGAAGAVTVDLGAGTSHGTTAGDVAKVGDDVFTGVSAVSGSAFNDRLTGSNNAANTAEEFSGRAGDDLIDGLGGFDRSFYHNDNQTLSGIHVDLAMGDVTGDDAIGHDTLRSVEGIRGTNFVDTYDASNFGGAGFLDSFINNVGSFGTFNEFEGMGGDDVVTGNGNTRIAFYNALDGVTVDLSAGFSHGTGATDVAAVGTDTFTGVNAVRGSGFADIITGSAGANTLEGQGGNDTLQGMGGADSLFGGGGADRFIFSATSESSVVSSDTIGDFVHASDVIDVSAISGITSVQGLTSGTTQVAAHSILWVQSGANTIVYMNSSGGAQDQSSADMKIVLTGVTASTITSSDFFHF